MVGLGGLLVTLLSSAYFHFEADREAQQNFDLRSKRYTLTVQMCLQEAVSASRSIRTIAESGNGADPSWLRPLTRLGEDEGDLHGIRWIAFLTAALPVAGAAGEPKQGPYEAIAASRDAPVVEGARIPVVPEFEAAVGRALATGKPAVYLPETEKGIDAPVYLNAIKPRAGEPRRIVLAVALKVDDLIGEDMAEFLARANQPPISTYAVRVLARPIDDSGARERLLVETAKLGQTAVPSMQTLLATGTRWLEHQGSAELDGTRYRIITAASRSEVDVPADRAVWWVLGIGLAATLMLSLTTSRIALARDLAEDTSRQLGSLVRSSEARFRNLVESTRDWMWETNAAGEVTFSSGRVHALLGITPREIVGRRCTDFGFGLDLERVAASGARTEITVMHRDGREVHLQCACSRFNDEHGQLAGYRGVCSDVTESRISADRQRILELELNRMDKVGTLDHVMSMVAHELNQPLAAVASYCGACVRMLRAPSTDLEEVISSMNAAASQAQVAAATVRGIRQFIVHKEPNIGSHRIEGMMRNAISLVAFRLDRARIRIESIPAPGLPAVLADEILIVQVLLNLLHNAIDAVSQVDDPRIVVRAEAAPGGRVRIAVEDNGPGMSDEQLARCLEPYVTTKTSGLGLGLSISQAIVESHGGALNISRNAGRGCTAEFSLAAAPEAEPPESSRMLSRSRR